jgi:hypothetical protein
MTQVEIVSPPPDFLSYSSTSPAPSVAFSDILIDVLAGIFISASVAGIASEMRVRF